VHGDAHPVLFYECAQGAEILSEMGFPIEFADWMGGEGDYIRAYAEKEKSILQVVFKDAAQAGEVGFHCLDEALFGIGGKAEGGAGGAAY
jgi:hypothetical protein